mmetsp:Transcript_15589/g.26835  ORF Transcript_15589/g.26835 Transcript_15589/m.26835 type:complete len:272 (+) Transcript_15589:46-861(+)|eukprot:CAMPEP_0196660028 /NCGR_PEP_ID=MMETSP1086-20130531/37768_1 /TAXON_ID=77921 /ORGANISM="Cyanoptyche  gloeocystis , Strain SAG4.97" /LENGTH=271 /DNA_ID=CAMNT_0041994243 /DNA_START=45 /DNA_END=860 /DNA_ORIENTATION=+
MTSSPANQSHSIPATETKIGDAPDDLFGTNEEDFGQFLKRVQSQSEYGDDDEDDLDIESSAGSRSTRTAVRSLSWKFKSLEKRLDQMVHGTVSEELVKLRDEVVRNKCELALVQADKQAAEDALSSAHADVEDLRHELTEMRQELSQTTADRNNIMEEVCKVKLRLAESESLREDLALRLAKLEAACSRHADDLKLKNSEIKVLKGYTGKAATDASLLSKIGKLQSQKKALVKKCEEQEAELLRTRNVMATLKNEANALSDQVRKFRPGST